MAINLRLELFPRSAQHLTDQLAPFLNRNPVWHGLNLPNKSKGDLPALLEHVVILQSAVSAPRAGSSLGSDEHRSLAPAAPATPPDICVHFAIAHNYGGSADASFTQLEDFACQLAGLQRAQHPPAVASSQPQCSSDSQARPSSSSGSSGGRLGVTLLLVSGSARRKLDSVQALERLVASPRFQRLSPPLPLAVAFNPYFPDPERQQEERRRLRRKLEAGRGRVAAVYLQAGSDAELLEQGLVFLTQLLDELQHRSQGQPAVGGAAQEGSCREQQDVQQQQQLQQQHTQQQQQVGSARPAKKARRFAAAPVSAPGTGALTRNASHPGDVALSASQPGEGPIGRLDIPQQQAITWARPAVHGSLLLPSKKLLAQMRFRPWAGVFLSEGYLSGVEAAEAATLRLLCVYRRHGVAPLVETEVAREAELAVVQRLLTDAAAAAVQQEGAACVQ